MFVLLSGASDYAFTDPVVWLTALVVAWTAVLPSVTAHALSVILNVHDKHKVIFLCMGVYERKIYLCIFLKRNTSQKEKLKMSIVCPFRFRVTECHAPYLSLLSLCHLSVKREKV